MKHRLYLSLACIFLAIPPFLLSAQESDVIYIEGWVDKKDNSGVSELMTGDRVINGDTVITGDDGIAELEPSRGSRITIQPGTIFSIREQTIDGKKYPVASATIGAISFKFSNMVAEPLIATPSAVMGVRGTEFTVYAGADGSSLVTVASGSVEISSMGESVVLEKEEGIEVQAGKSPGTKFKVMGKPADFSEWNSKKEAGMLQDPAAALAAIADQLNAMLSEAEKWYTDYSSRSEELEKKRYQVSALFDEGKDQDARDFYRQQVKPLEVETLQTVMNYRYYALSALSIRQYVLTGFYIRMQTAYLCDREEAVYTDFISTYSALTEDFQAQTAVMLEDTDF